MPYLAPFDEPLRQNKPPKKAGANCAINTKDINPIETNERSKVKLL